MTQQRQTARTAALRALLQVDQNAGFSNLVLDNTLHRSALNEADKALASAIFYGVLERRLTLDYFLRQCLDHPDKKLESTVQEALRCGAYQILYLDRVPDSAAVNETVTALKNLGKSAFSGFVNGVLRNLARKKDRLELPSGDGLPALALRYSVPLELIEFWQKSYGKAVTGKLLETLSVKPDTYIRINETKCTVEELSQELEKSGVKLSALTSPPGSAILSHCGAPGSLEAFQKGLFHVQDLSAQWVCGILDPQPGETICDCCAAPGGKSFTIAQMVGGEGKVYALDLYESRLRLIQKGAVRLGLTQIESRTSDCTQEIASIPQQVDRMLCDVPCSGLGVIRRKPEIRYKKLDSIQKLPEVQYQILLQASKKVKPGGRLVYSTCTLNPAENQEIAKKFLQENNGFEPVKIETGLPHCVDEPEYMLTMMPFAGASDGFFAAAFRKKAERE